MRIFAFEGLRNTASKLDHFKPALHIALRILDNLAMLGRQKLGERLHIRLDQLLIFEHDPSALLRIGRRPFGLHLFGCRHRLLKQSGIPQSNLGLHFAG